MDNSLLAVRGINHKYIVVEEVVALDVIDVNTGQLQEVEIKGHYGVFTELRVDKSTIPEGVNCYELRHGDDDS